MSAQQLAVGDTVELKSGGPTMTIVHLDEDLDQMECTWFASAGGSLQRGRFPPIALRYVAPYDPDGN